MKISEIAFPIEGNVQTVAHFYDQRGNYVFSFASPFCYNEPAEMKAKNAFLLAGFMNPKKKSSSPEEIFSFFINKEEKQNHPDGRVKASVRETVLYDGNGEPQGTVDVLLQRGFFRSYAGMHPNPVYDKDRRLIGFCHYNSEEKSKNVYTCDENFSHLNESISAAQIKELEAAGAVHRVFSYDIVESEDADNKDRFLSIFFPSKKSELSNNRIRFYGSSLDDEKLHLLLTALFAFFWGTYIDIPMNG